MTTNGGSVPVFCTIVPPHVLDRLARAEDPGLSGPARRSLPAARLELARRPVRHEPVLRPGAG
ncbi:peptidase M4 family protein, partial [Streptomyces sp. 900105245]